jgi:hypothetical protein
MGKALISALLLAVPCAHAMERCRIALHSATPECQHISVPICTLEALVCMKSKVSIVVHTKLLAVKFSVNLCRGQVHALHEVTV